MKSLLELHRSVAVARPRVVRGRQRQQRAAKLGLRGAHRGRQTPGNIGNICFPNVPRINLDSEKPPLTCRYVVGDTGFEPVTSSVSGKRATTAPIARGGDGI